MRIGLEWDIAYIARPLVAIRVHTDAASLASLSTSPKTGYHLDRAPTIHFQRRMQFLDEARLTQDDANRYRAIARRTLWRESAQSLNLQAGAGSLSWTSTTAKLLQLVRADPRMLLVPATWRLTASQLGGRQARRAIRQLRNSVPRRKAHRKNASDKAPNSSGGPSRR